MVSIIGPIIAYNAYSCLALGILFNMALLLIAKRYTTSLELREFRSITLYFCTQNLCMLVVQAIAQPMFFVGPNTLSYIVLNGPVTMLNSQHLSYACFFVYLLLYSQMILSLAFQFVDRYFVVCRLNRHRTRRYAALFSTNLVIIFVMAISFWKDMSLANGVELRDFPDVFKLLSGQNQIACVIDAKSNFALFSIQFVVIFASYFTILLCFQRIWAFVKRNFRRKSGTYFEGNRQKAFKEFTLNLLLQAAVPLICQTISLLSLINIILGINSAQLLPFQLLLFLPFNWIPVLNPLLALLTIREYRLGLLAMLGVKQKSAPVEFCVRKRSRQVQMLQARQTKTTPRTTIAGVGGIWAIT